MPHSQQAGVLHAQLRAQLLNDFQIGGLNKAMMLSKNDPVPESELMQYLLGSLPAEKREHFDELSVADDEIAERLCAVENDLVDAYVAGELHGDALSQFESHYLCTPYRRDKVEMARLLTKAGGRPEANTKTKSSILPMRARGEMAQNLRDPYPRYAAAMNWRWASVAAIILLSISTAWLGFSNFRLHNQDRSTRAANGELQERLSQLQSRLDTERGSKAQKSSPTGANDTGARSFDSTTALVGSIFLLPQRRGAEEIPTASVSGKTGLILLQLQLESDDFPGYKIEVRSLANNRTVWRGDAVKSERSGQGPTLSVLLPSESVNSNNYIAEVSGISRKGRAELVSGYVFKIAKGALR